MSLRYHNKLMIFLFQGQKYRFLKYNKIRKFMVKLLFGADALMIITFLLRFNRLPPQSPLFYSRLWGEDQLADTWLIFILPVFLNLLFFLNNYLFKKIYSDNEFIKKIFYYLNLFLILSFTLIFIKIIFLVS